MQCILDALQEMSTELIAQFKKCCGLNLAINDSEAGQINCFQASQPCENEPGFNPFSGDNDDVEDGNDDGNE